LAQVRSAEAIRPEGAPSGADVRGLIAALVEGDRNAIFAALRMHVRGGGSPEALVTKIAFALDDAYRARIDGTPADPEIVRMIARLDTQTLERLVSSLTNAIDSSYSTGITGAKLALSRALSTLGA
jgi:DNA-binding transcriptional ArsR family regulator